MRIAYVFDQVLPSSATDTEQVLNTVAALAADVATRIRTELPDRPLVAVTHSLGGILVRHMASELPWRGVLMLAPPNAGSRVAEGLRDNPLFRWYFGPAALDVARADGWPAPPTPCGVIAGQCGMPPAEVPETDATHEADTQLSSARRTGGAVVPAADVATTSALAER